jgi:dihydrofolate reductase
MRKVVSLMHMSLDGFVAGPKGEMDWIKIDDQIFDHVDRFIAQADTGFYGPKTFQMMEDYWPGVLKDPKAVGHQLNHAKWYALAKKYVFSTSLKKLNNPTAELVKADLPGKVAALKKEQGKNLMIFGSPGLTHSFAQLGLIDEYVILINPLILGSGIPMFKGIVSRANLKLISATEFKIGVVGFHYSKLG